MSQPEVMFLLKDTFNVHNHHCIYELKMVSAPDHLQYHRVESKIGEASNNVNKTIRVNCQ